MLQCLLGVRKKRACLVAYTTFPWDALCGEVAKLRIQRRTPDNIVALRAAVAATSAFDDDPPEPEREPDPPAPPPLSGGPRNRGLARSLATPLATPAADPEGIRGDVRWRRRESKPRHADSESKSATLFGERWRGDLLNTCRRHRTAGIVNAMRSLA